ARQPEIWDAAHVVQRDDSGQGRHAAIMHVRSPARDVPEGWCFEGALVGIATRDREAPEVGVLAVHADADVAVSLVGEVEADVAPGAVGLPLEEGKTALGRQGHRRPITGFEPIVWGITRNDRAHVGGDGPRDTVRVQVPPEDVAMLRLVDGYGPEVGHGAVIA